MLAQEPGGTRTGQLIRKLLLDSASTELEPTTELLLFFAARVQNLSEVILPALADGKLVISDRFTDATVAYQGHGRGLGPERVLQLNEYACSGIQPDLTLWLDVDPEVSVQRARARNEAHSVDEGLMESQSMKFFARVRQGYASLQQTAPDRVRRVSADGPEEMVGRRVLELVLSALEERGLNAS